MGDGLNDNVFEDDECHSCYHKKNKIEGLKRLLRMAKCPEMLIENPGMGLGELTAEDRTWAENQI